MGRPRPRAYPLRKDAGGHHGDCASTCSRNPRTTIHQTQTESAIQGFHCFRDASEETKRVCATIDTVTIPNPLADAPSMPTTQKLHTDPVTGTIHSTWTQRPSVEPRRAEFVTSVHETLPQHRIFRGVAATQLSGNSALPTSASHPVEMKAHENHRRQGKRTRSAHSKHPQSKLRYRSSSAEGGMGTIGDPSPTS